MSGDSRHRVRGVLAAVVLVVTAACTFVAAAWLADRVTTQSDEVVQPAIDDPVIVPGPMAPTDGAADGAARPDGTAQGPVDPGAVVALADAGPAVDGLPGGAWMLPVDLVAGDGSGSTGPAPGQPATTEPTTGTTLIPADQAVGTAEQLGSVSVQPPLRIARFVDRCTTGTPPCPIGVAGTIKPLAGDVQPATLQIRLWSGLTKATYPTLRCDPGYPDSATLPVVVTANQPLDSLDVSLELPDGRLLSNAIQGQSWSEAGWFANRQAGGQAIGTDLDNGLQYCASVKTLGDAAVAAQVASGGPIPSPLVYRLVARGRRTITPAPGEPASDQVAEAVADVPAASLPSSSGARPTTIVAPLNGHVAQIVVSERADMTVRPTVWAANAFYWKDKGGLGSAAAYCAKAPPGAPDPGFYDPPKPLLVPAAQTYDPGQLAQASYPFNRDYTRYSVWNAVLEEGTTYAVCISWPLPSGEEREAWTLETPNGLRFSFLNATLQRSGNTPNQNSPWKDWYLRSGTCNMHFPEGTDVLGGSLCRSWGLPYPAVQVFEHSATYPTPSTGSGTITDEMGTTKVKTPTWCTDVYAELTPIELIIAASSGGSSLLYQCASGTATIEGASWPVSFSFGDPNVLCSGSGCDQYHYGDVRTTAAVEEGNSNARGRDPLDWGVQGPVAS